MVDCEKVQTPKIQGKITFATKKSGVVYVLYEYNRVYDPKRQFNIPKRSVIGRLVDGHDREWMIPNKNFATHFPDVVLSPQTHVTPLARPLEACVVTCCTSGLTLSFKRSSLNMV